mgnify:CR=1 FL=1
MSVINTNYLALVSQNNLTKSQNSLGTAIERLSSGLRINSAKDDAAGQAIANRFTANVNGLTQAARNANDGISVAQTTEGALNEINENLQRIRTLTVQASTGSNSSEDLQSIQNEIKERVDEINRVSEQTDFNGVKVLGADAGELRVQVGSKDNQQITINLSQINSKTLSIDDFDVTKAYAGNGLTKVSGKAEAAGATINTATITHSSLDQTAATSIAGVGKADDGNWYAQIAGGTDAGFYKIAVNEDTGAVTTVTLDAANKLAEPDGYKATTVTSPAKPAADATVDLTGSTAEGGKVDGLYQDKEGQYYAKVSGATDADGNGYYKVNVDNATGAVTLDAKADFPKPEGSNAKPLEALDSALQKVDDLRSHLGAIQNRFQSTIANLNNTVNNLSAARSRIEDADYAVEVSNMTRSQILQQAGTSVLAQANQVPQTVLSLLR